MQEKNREELLREELFTSPTGKYRGIPFWSWNCKVTKELIDWQLDCFVQMGFGGVDIHPRTGLDVAYLGEEYLELTAYAVKRCEEKGLVCWLYDDDRFPSGTADGIVTQNVKYRGRYLLLTKQCLQEGYCESRELFEEACERGEKPLGYFAGIYVICLEDGYLAGYQSLTDLVEAEAAKERGERIRFAYVKLFEEERWFEGQAYLDTMSPVAVRAFIDSTHEKYYALLGEKFGKSVPAIFTDEPRMAPRKKRTQKISFAESAEDIIIPYTEYFEEQMQKNYGVNIWEKLPEYIWELPGGEKSSFRYQYQNMLAECFTASFMDQICEWCREHGIAMTGHVLGEDSVVTQAYVLGDCMRTYRRMDLPGVDVLVDYPQFLTVKQAVSVTRQNGKAGTVSELYGVTQWDCDFKTYKLQGDWQAALGITIRVPHLSWMSMEGEAKRDWPASIFYQSPWYTEYPYIEDYFARLNTVLTRGKACVSVGVVHPVESAWLSMGPSDQCRDALRQADERLEELTRWLLFGSVDFDFLSESLLPEQCAEYLEHPGRELAVGAMNYKVVLVPDMKTMRSTTLRILERFAEQGGKLIFLGKVPEYEDAIPSDAVRKLAEKHTVLPWQMQELFDQLIPFRDVEIYRADGNRASDLFYQMRQEQSCRWLFLCHVTKTNRHPSAQEHYRIRLKGNYRLTQYDALTGSVADWMGAFTCRDGMTEFEWDCYEQDSLLLCLQENMGEIVQEKIEEEKYQTILSLKEADKCVRQEPNMLLLDYARYRIEDGPVGEREEILRLDNQIREELGLASRGEDAEQPWFLEEGERHQVTLFYEFSSEIATEARLGIERPEDYRIWLNGEVVDTQPIGYYVDKAILVIPLPKLRPGENQLKLEVDFHQKTNLENLYLLGDFGVRLQGNRASICKEEKVIGVGDITLQGMPFYTGNLDEYFIFSVEEEGEYYVQITHFSTPLLRVWIDGEERGRIAFAPHRLSLGRLVAGTHRLQIRIYGNRHNGFGYLHNTNDDFTWYGPLAYRTEGDEWTDCYRVRPAGILSGIEIWCKQEG